VIAPRQPSARLEWHLLVGPVLLLAGLVLLEVSNELVSIGPFDRAQFGWSVPVPMMLLAPGVIGASARWAGVAAARNVATITGAAFGVVLGIAWFASVTQVGCDPAPGISTRLAASMPIPVVLGVGWAIAGRSAARYANRPAVAVAVGVVIAIAAGIAMLLTWAALFPGVTCAYVPPPA
jgi:hypothetical protein